MQLCQLASSRRCRRRAARARPPPQRLDSRLRQPADGPVERDLSRAAALVHHRDARASGRRRWARSTELPRPPLPSPSWRRAACPTAPPGASRGSSPAMAWPLCRSRCSRSPRAPPKSWARASPTGIGKGIRGAPARRNDRRRDAARNSRPGVRPPPVARHRRGDDRAGRGDRADGLVRRRYPRGLLGRGDPRLSLLPARLAGAQGAGARPRPDPAHARSSPASASSTGRRGACSRSASCSRSPASRKAS